MKVAEVKSKGREFDAKFDKAAKDAENKYQQIKSEAGTKFSETRKEAAQAIDNFDKTVEKKAAEAKSGISSWWGGGKWAASWTDNGDVRFCVQYEQEQIHPTLFSM